MPAHHSYWFGFLQCSRILEELVVGLKKTVAALRGGAVCFLAGFGLSQAIVMADNKTRSEYLDNLISMDVIAAELETTVSVAETVKPESALHDGSTIKTLSLVDQANTQEQSSPMFSKNWVNEMAYPDLFGRPVLITHKKLKAILPDESEDRLLELAVQLEAMEPGHAITLLVALSRNYQSGDLEKTALYDAMAGVSPNLGRMAFAMELAVNTECDKNLSATDMLMLISNRRISRGFARIYQKRRAGDLDYWTNKNKVCSKVGFNGKNV